VERVPAGQLLLVVARLPLAAADGALVAGGGGRRRARLVDADDGERGDHAAGGGRARRLGLAGL
jgi:hypothetical protein